jgi:tRNA U54 and U55 pseudouridine synthase Pus10
MEREMNAGSSIVQVNSMAPCSKESFEKMKNQVADKKKTYRCIVQVSRALVPADLAPVDALVDVEVHSCKRMFEYEFE